MASENETKKDTNNVAQKYRSSPIELSSRSSITSSNRNSIVNSLVEKEPKKNDGESSTSEQKYRSSPIQFASRSSIPSNRNSIVNSLVKPPSQSSEKESNKVSGESSTKEESDSSAQKYRSSPIQFASRSSITSNRNNSIVDSMIKTPSQSGQKESCGDQQNGTELKQKYMSCPIRNSVRNSIVSKRHSMTNFEYRFVEDMLHKSLSENELKNMAEILRCDNTFFPAEQREDLTNTEEEPSIPAKNPIASRRCSTSDLHLGSKKRQEYLEERKKRSAEQCKTRSSGLWKRAALKALAVSRFSKAAKDRQMKMKRNETPIQNDTHIETEKETEDEQDTNETLEVEEPQKPSRKPLFLKRASANVYDGEGFEIGVESFGDDEKKDGSRDDDDDEGEENDEISDTIRSFSALSTPRGEGFRRASVSIYGGDGYEVATEDSFDEVYDGEDRKSYEDYDPWLFQEIDKDGKRREFSILGTSHDDHDCHPHVLSPVQMDRFQPFLPDSKKGESFWLKYSLVRDGASMISFLKQVRASPYTLLAMETVDGEVFGGFFSNAWTVQPGYFGTGESFLWRMKHVRKIPGGELEEETLAEQIEKESDLEIFPSEVYYANNFFQMCHQETISAGGGAVSLPQDFGEDRGGTYVPHEIGFGLQLGGGQGSLLEGSSSASLTYRNPPLARSHKDGSVFELLNLEAWGFTPCRNEEEARVLEYKNMFFRKHSSMSSV